MIFAMEFNYADDRKALVRWYQRKEKAALLVQHQPNYTRRHHPCLPAFVVDSVRTNVKYRAFDRSRELPSRQSVDFISPKVSRQASRHLCLTAKNEKVRKKKRQTLTRVRERATFPTRGGNRWD
jgi:hypothetical protein